MFIQRLSLCSTSSSDSRRPAQTGASPARGGSVDAAPIETPRITAAARDEPVKSLRGCVRR